MQQITKQRVLMPFIAAVGGGLTIEICNAVYKFYLWRFGHDEGTAAMCAAVVVLFIIGGIVSALEVSDTP